MAIHKTDGTAADEVTKAFLKADEVASKILILVDAHIPLDQVSVVCWKLFNNIDAKRDITTQEVGKDDVRVVIDATKKLPTEGHHRIWPDDIVMSEDVKAYVTHNWEAYKIDTSH